MRRWTQKIVVVLATGYILFFYSERMFWSFLRPGDKTADLLLTWIVYSMLAWVFLLLVRQCRIAAFPALFLAGAVFGWLAEGVVVDTLYGNADNPFPASISFTGLAWHALISVGVGWYWQARGADGGQSEEDRAVFGRGGRGLGPVGRVVASRVGQSQHVAGSICRAHAGLLNSADRRLACLGHGEFGVVSTRQV